MAAMSRSLPKRLAPVIALLVTAVVYWPGLSGSWLFDDYPNIVDNPGVQPHHAGIPSLVRAALSSPSSQLKRPLSSLSFAANYLTAGLDPYGMKLTNLAIHLLNGWLVFLLARRLIEAVGGGMGAALGRWGYRTGAVTAEAVPTEVRGLDAGLVAALVAAGWLLLPINLTGVLYVVQRMESMANAFVLLGLLGYVAARQRMLRPPAPGAKAAGGWGYVALCAASLVVFTAVGILAKETAVMLPFYAALVEWLLFGFRRADGRRDGRIGLLFVVVLLLPMAAGLAWLLPNVLNPASWVTRDFTLRTRLLSEARIVVDYIGWTLLPLPHELSFYHDNFAISSGLLHPWTTLASILVLLALVAAVIVQRRRRPLLALGLALYLGCHLLTATVLPLELVYEHRNYFASFGLLLALVPLLCALPGRSPEPAMHRRPGLWVLALLLLFWCGQTAASAYAWGDPLRLAETLARRAPTSPRAQYELGRTDIIYSHYSPYSPYTRLAYAPLERAAALPESSILPQQALIFMNSRMRLPLKDAWWDSMIAKLKLRKPGVQDESSLAALTECARSGQCALPPQRMQAAFLAALSHPSPSARLLAMYGDYAWNVLDDHDLGEQMTRRAVQATPSEPAYRITLARMAMARGQAALAQQQIDALARLNVGGRLQGTLDALRAQLARP